MGNRFAVDPSSDPSANEPSAPEPVTPVPDEIEQPTPETEAEATEVEKDPEKEKETPDANSIKTKIADTAAKKIQNQTEAKKARLAALAETIVVPNDALEAYFTALNMQKMRFAQFKQQLNDRMTMYTLPIIDFKVLYYNKTLATWIPRAPSPYKQIVRSNKTPQKINVTPFRPFKPREKTALDDFQFREVPPAEVALRAMIRRPPELADYEPVFCAVLTDRATHVKFTIPADGIRRADEASIAALFLQTYTDTCRPPGWTLSQKVSDVDRYIRDGDTLLHDAPIKDPEALRAQLALEKQLAVYAVGTQSWTDMARKVYLVGSTTDEADLALTRRLPCKGFNPKELQKFGYTTSGFQDAATLLPPVGVYVRTPFVGRAQADAAPAHAAVTAAQGVVDAAKAAKKADATNPDPSPDEIRSLQAAQNALVEALTPPVYSLDVVNVTGPVFEKGTREYKAALAVTDREAWVLRRLEECFDILFFVAEHEHKHALVMPLLGSGKDFVPLGLAPTYEEYFTKVLQATMALHPRIKVYFIGQEIPGTRPAKFPDIIDEQSDALFVNDMGPEYVVGNCHFSDPSPNGYFGSHSAMAYLTEPAINAYISVKTLMSTPRDYTRPPPVAVPQARQDPFTPPENAPSDYVVERGTLTELALAGDALVRDGYVPCGTILEHRNTLYQAFVRLRVDPAPLWERFEQKRHRVKELKN